MTSNFFVEERRKQKAALLEVLNKNADKPLAKLLGLFSARTGLSLKVINAYVKELADAELVEHKEVV